MSERLPLQAQIDADPRRPLSVRAVLIGTFAVVLVCLVVPVNDLVYSNNSLAAGFLPVLGVLVQFVLVALVNAMLHRFAPRQALSGGELGIVTMMLLIGASLPNWGFARFFVPTPVAPFFLGTNDDQFWRPFEAMNLPRWLFPVDSLRDGRSSTAVSWFYNSTPADEHTPWRAWLVPLAAWGVFIGAMLVTFVSLSRLLLDQWLINERLPFPLVQVQTDLIAPPPRGRAFNDLLRSPALWIGLGVVFFIHSTGALNAYFPTYVPRIPVGYDFTNLFTDGPLQHLRTRTKATQIFFSAVGATYFIRSRAAFSLWGIYLLVNLIDVRQGVRGEPVSTAAWADEHLGACVAFILGMLWVGRLHWKRVVLNAIGRGDSSTYRVSAWLTLVGTATMIAWLCFLGVKPWWAGVIVAIILAAHIVVSRVVAETGLPIYRAGISASQIYGNLPTSMFSPRDIYFAGVFTILGPLTTRDSVMANSLQALAVEHRSTARRPSPWALGTVVGWTLLVGVVTSIASTMWVHYTHPTPQVRDVLPEGNVFGAVYTPKRDMADQFVAYSNNRFTPQQHSTARHVGTGFVVTVLLQIGALRFAGWPLLPVGFVACHGAFIANVWFSIFVGWLAKVLLVRFGGASLYTKARPLFVGLILGEALAAGFWLLVNFLVVVSGGEVQTMRFLL